MVLYGIKITWDLKVKQHCSSTSPLSHDTVMQVFLLFDEGMISTCPLAAFAIVTAENGGQLLLGHSVRRQGDGAFLSQAPSVLHKAQSKSRHFNNKIHEQVVKLVNVFLNLLVFNLSAGLQVSREV